MKKIIVIIASLGIYMSSMAQSNSSELQSPVAKLDRATTAKNYEDAAKEFSAIAEEQKSQWLPYYYAAFSYAKIGWLYQDDGEKIEPYADKADEMIQKALSFLDTVHQKKELSEIYVVQSMSNRARVFINPPTYGRKYGPVSSRYTQQARTADPENPRALYLEGWEKYATPKLWGGDKKKAKELLQVAKQQLEKNKSFDTNPHWGIREVDELLAKLK